MPAAVNALKASSDFTRLSREGKKWVTPGFILLALARGEPHKNDPLRLGLTVSRKVGNAVARNRAKRRLREAVRIFDGVEKLKGLDIVLIARAQEKEQPFANIGRDFSWALKRLEVLA